MHPFKGQSKDGKATAKARYASGGAVKLPEPVSMPTIPDTSGAKSMDAETPKPTFRGKVLEPK